MSRRKTTPRTVYQNKNRQRKGLCHRDGNFQLGLVSWGRVSSQRICEVTDDNDLTDQVKGLQYKDGTYISPFTLSTDTSWRLQPKFRYGVVVFFFFTYPWVQTFPFSFSLSSYRRQSKGGRFCMCSCRVTGLDGIQVL